MTQETIIKSGKGRNRVQIRFTQPSLTKQSFQKECDINNIMARYQKTGVIEHFSRHAQQYSDTDGQTFTEAMQTVANAQSMFEELPSKARAYFEHDPAKFLDFVYDLDPETGQAQLIELGLASREAIYNAIQASRETETASEPAPEAPKSDPEPPKPAE